MRSYTVFLVSLLLSSTSLAAPAPIARPSPVPTAAARLEDRDLIGDLLGDVSDLLGDVVSDLNGVFSDIEDGNLVGTAAWSAIEGLLTSVTATTTQTNAASAISTLSSIHAAQPSANLYEFIASIVAEGLTVDSVTDALQFVTGELTGESNSNNVNTRSPSTTIYPQKACGDAPYSLDEGTLRAAIYIPSTFTYGSVPPVILVPGTGNLGYQTFQGNFIQLFTGTSYADPVWLNIPGYLLGDAQVNAEYVAYAINYINGITKHNVSVLAWSQGNIDTQWAFKYWPSTTKVTSNHIAISPDYAGTVNANLICPDGLPCDPSVFQQQYLGSSNFITTLRSNNGDSAYVPTTVIYSGLFDEIVEPQQGTGASAYLNDARHVGVTNSEVQTVCSGLAGGSFYTHEGMLYNPLAFALAKDALVNGGPGQPSRVDLTTVCNQYLATGLNVGDLLLTENSILIAGLALVLYEPKVTEEPAISGYALNSVTTCSASSTSTSSHSTTSTSTSHSTTSTSTSHSTTPTSTSHSTTPTSTSHSTTSTSTSHSTTSTSTSHSTTTTSTSTSHSTTTTKTTTSASSTPTTTTANCPGDNGKIYVSSGKRFVIECSTDHNAGDLKMVYVNNGLAGCIAQCASNSQCVDVSLSGTACYLKSSLGASSSSGVNGARLLT